VAALCLLGAARISFATAALPLFTDTDEPAHFDLVRKLARGYWPNQPVEHLDPDTARAMTLHGTFEYTFEPHDTGAYPVFEKPVRDWRKDRILTQWVRTQYGTITKSPNQEAYEPPVYYALAAAWYRLGRALGLSEPRAIYWVRFLNVPLYGALVAAAYAFGRPYFGRDTALAAAALTAFFPNTVYFQMSNDVLSPLAGVLALLLLLRWYRSDRPGPLLSAAAGAMAATALLVKLSNAAILVALAAVVLLRLRHERRPGKVLAESWLLLASAALPLALWVLRNRLVLGTWSGAGGRLAARNLHTKPFSELLNHPMFTEAGPPEFLCRLCDSFFRGDANWHGAVTYFEPSRVFFLVTAALLPVVGLVAALRRARQDPDGRLAAGMAALVVVASVGELAFLSLLVIFPDLKFPPSRQFPFYTFGRLTGGALVPFLTLYASGVKALLGRWPRLFAGAVAAAVVMMILGQWAFLGPALASPFNWYHIR
jgi:4-amino-4-deoxy-L-arabinose transferase-like glycosyltransferase